MLNQVVSKALTRPAAHPVGLAFAMLLLQTSRDVLRRDTPQDAARRRDRRGCSTRGKLWHRPSDGPIRKVFAASHCLGAQLH